MDGAAIALWRSCELVVLSLRYRVMHNCVLLLVPVTQNLNTNSLPKWQSL
jgi:hypothetical protein